MHLYIIRHGKPDYETDTLLPEGWEQAELVAKRLMHLPIDRIYASPMGRAQETAQPLSRATGIPIEMADWAYEIGEESMTTYPDGEPKDISSLDPVLLQAPSVRLLPTEDAFQTLEPYRHSGFPARYRALVNGLDGLLSENGYVRTGEGFYAPVSPSDRKIALFCHAGMMRALYAHLLNIPIQLFTVALQVHFTGISVIYFQTSPNGSTVCPTLISLGDTGHLPRALREEMHYRNGEPF